MPGSQETGHLPLSCSLALLCGNSDSIETGGRAGAESKMDENSSPPHGDASHIHSRLPS